MSSPASKSDSTRWLIENGPKQLELLFRAIVFHPSAPILLADDDRRSHEASAGAGRLLGIPREKIIGRSIDDFAKPGAKHLIPEQWRVFLNKVRSRERCSFSMLRAASAKSNTWPRAMFCRFVIFSFCAIKRR